ncbi:iron-containing alcohol dehydrogenase PsrA [Variovorax sp. VNK109]|uniref:iron-containing alcohol dehydrogenase PsrA n=1 Tax=Variovorax sp. VNK109 TaxID=3400919 RepID=UPI003C02F654
MRIPGYHNPVHIHMGAGALASLGALVQHRTAMLVTFPEARGLGLISRVEAALGKPLAGVIDQVQPNPDVMELAPMYDAFWRDHGDTEVLLAVGGGSAIDTAKALMTSTAEGGFDALLAGLRGQQPLRAARAKTLIAIPTTAGTGSEVTPWATVWDRAERLKYSLHLPETWPAHAVIDAELMLSLPASVTLSSALDALSHALEAIWNVNANPLSDTFAVAAVHDVLDVLPLLMEQPQRLELRERMALAALRAGMAFSNTRTALAHSISYEMTLHHGLPHGIACSFTLPMVLSRALGHDVGRDSVLTQALAPLIEANATGSSRDLPAALATFMESLGVKTRFADYGVSDDDAERMVAHAMQGARGRNFIAAGPVAAN